MTDTGRRAAEVRCSKRAATGGLRHNRWREISLVAVTAISAYSAAICWQCQVVSYPIFAAVSARDFPTYHLHYNDSILGVVIIPGLVSFLTCALFPLTRPAGVSRRTAGMVSVCGLTSLAATAVWAIPLHHRLDEIGQSQTTIDDLLKANLVRTMAMTVGTAVLMWLSYTRLNRGSP